MLCVTCLLFCSGLFAASNTGFKITWPFTSNIKYWISIPYNSPYVTADDLLSKILGGGGTVTRQIPLAIPAVEFWTGSAGSNFTVIVGEGYELLRSTTGNGVIVGSHDPSLQVPQSGFLNQIDYWVSIPYHTRAETADDLLGEMPNGGTVTRMVPGAIQAFQFWTGSSGDNFSIEIGAMYRLRPAGTSAGFIPSHF